MAIRYSRAFVCVLLAALCASRVATAAPCGESGEFEPNIFNCGDNSVASEHAKACLLHLQTISKTEIASIRDALATNDPVEIEVAAKRANYSIRLMQIEAARVLGYKEVLIVPPDAGRDDFPCYSDAQDDINHVLSEANADVGQVAEAYRNALVVLQRLKKSGMGVYKGIDENKLLPK